MRIALFVPCFVDQFYPQAALSMANVLHRLGHQVEIPTGLTCCGQPPFNSGYWEEARTVARHILSILSDFETIVAGSGSCAAMLRVFYPELWQGRPESRTAATLAAKTHEFSEFLVRVLGIHDLGASYHGKVTLHDGCHGLRELGLDTEARTLLRHVRGLELVEMAEAKTCCGFGGTFAVKFPQISTAMGEVKCSSILQTGADTVVSNDLSCLMQIEGILRRQGHHHIRCLHLAQILDSTQN